MRRLTTIPSVTAGLMWQPEIGPTAKAMASRESPNAMATPTLPTWPPAITAVVKPAKTRTNVPNNSAAYFIFHLERILNCLGHSHPVIAAGTPEQTFDRESQVWRPAGILHGPSCFGTCTCAQVPEAARARREI